jgi:hypothetical protein
MIALIPAPILRVKKINLDLYYQGTTHLKNL